MARAMDKMVFPKKKKKKKYLVYLSALWIVNNINSDKNLNYIPTT